MVMLEWEMNVESGAPIQQRTSKCSLSVSSSWADFPGQCYQEGAQGPNARKPGWPVTPTESRVGRLSQVFGKLNLSLFFFFFKLLFIYLFILGCVGSSFLCEGFLQLWEAGPLFIAVRGPLTVVASLVAEHRLQTRRLSSCGSRA